VVTEDARPGSRLSPPSAGSRFLTSDDRAFLPAGSGVRTRTWGRGRAGSRLVKEPPMVALMEPQLTGAVGAPPARRAAGVIGEFDRGAGR
jgi:hypothetical protein